MCNYYEALIILVLIDIFSGIVYRYLDNRKPSTLTTWEFYSYMYDNKEEIKNILQEENREIRNELFNNYLKTRDLIRNTNERDNKK